MLIRVKRGLEAGRLSITPNMGEPLFTTDTKKLYIGDGVTPGGIAVDLGAPPAPVQSVAGKTGAVTLDKSDVGLGNAENTSDANKPVSTAQQTALDGKVDKTGDVMTGSLTATTLTAGTATDVLGTALSVIRNNMAVGRIDNNASGLRVQAQNGSLQLRGTGNTGIAIDASGNAVVAGTITGANLSGTYIAGTGFPNGVVSAPVGSIYIDTAITNGASSWIKKSGTGNTGWQVLDGDTGWREISSSLINGWAAGELLLRRVNAQVYIRTEALSASAMTSANVFTLPAGFKAFSTALSTSSERQFLTTATNPAAVWRATTPSSGVLTIQGSTTGLALLYGTLQFTTPDAWPTTLPGTPA